jgi:hypothetical protein
MAHAGSGLAGLLTLKRHAGGCTDRSGLTVAAATPPVAGYLAWYDATQMTSLADGAACTSWTDKSVNGFNAAFVGTAPLFYKTTAANLINGHPAMKFASAGSSGFAATISATVTPVTVYAVCKETSGGTVQAAVFTLKPATTAVGNFRYNGAGGNFQLAGLLGVTGGTQDALLHQFTMQINTSGATSLVREDATQIMSGNCGNTSTWTEFDIGCYSGVAGYYFDGLFGEVILYAALHNLTQIQSVEGYLKSKWGTP